MEQKQMKKQLFIFWVSVYLIAPTQAGVPNSGPLARIGEDGAFSFVVIGDTRTGIPVFKHAVYQELGKFPDFAFYRRVVFPESAGALKRRIFPHVNGIQYFQGAFARLCPVTHGYFTFL